MRVSSLLCAATLAAMAGAGLAANPASAATLVHAYDFTTSSGGVVLDTAAGGGANGTLLNGASVAGGILNLDGVDDYVQFSTKIVPTGGDFSVFIRAEFLPKLSPSGYTELISQGFSGGPGFYIGEAAGGGLRVGDFAGNPGFAVPVAGAFHNLFLTFGASTLTFSIDGATPYVTAFSGFTTGGGDTRLGQQFCCSEPFHGRYDTVKIYSGVATYAEASAAGGPAAAPEPAAWSLMILGFTGLGAVLRRRRAETLIA